MHFFLVILNIQHHFAVLQCVCINIIFWIWLILRDVKRESKKKKMKILNMQLACDGSWKYEETWVPTLIMKADNVD